MLWYKAWRESRLGLLISVFALVRNVLRRSDHAVVQAGCGSNETSRRESEF
jgi:hypothetical protein